MSSIDVAYSLLGVGIITIGFGTNYQFNIWFFLLVYGGIGVILMLGHILMRYNSLMTAGELQKISHDQYPTLTIDLGNPQERSTDDAITFFSTVFGVKQDDVIVKNETPKERVYWIQNNETERITFKQLDLIKA